MTRTHDFGAFDRAASKFPTVVSAEILDRVILAVEIKNDDLNAVDVSNTDFAELDFAGLGDGW